MYGPIAQLVEQLAFNQWVAGSSPARLTTSEVITPMTDEEDPLSTANIGIHLLKLLILLAGGCVLETIKHAWEPPLVTNTMLNIGEFTILVYMVGALGQAFHWSWKQWTNGKPILAAEGRSLLKQFVPRKIDLGSALRLPRLLRQFLIWVIAFLVVFFLMEYVFVNNSQPLLNARNGAAPKSSISIFLGSPQPISRVPRNLTQLAVSEFNVYSSSILIVLAALFGLAICAAVLVVLYNRRKASV